MFFIVFVVFRVCVCVYFCFPFCFWVFCFCLFRILSFFFLNRGVVVATHLPDPQARRKKQPKIQKPLVLQFLHLGERSGKRKTTNNEKKTKKNIFQKSFLAFLYLCPSLSLYSFCFSSLLSLFLFSVLDFSS